MPTNPDPNCAVKGCRRRRARGSTNCKAHLAERQGEEAPAPRPAARHGAPGAWGVSEHPEGAEGLSEAAGGDPGLPPDVAALRLKARRELGRILDDGEVPDQHKVAAARLVLGRDLEAAGSDPVRAPDDEADLLAELESALSAAAARAERATANEGGDDGEQATEEA